MNISRKHRLHEHSKENFYCLYGKHTPESWLLAWDWKTYYHAEHAARNRVSHREFRKEIKKGGIL